MATPFWGTHSLHETLETNINKYNLSHPVNFSGDKRLQYIYSNESTLQELTTTAIFTFEFSIYNNEGSSNKNLRLHFNLY